VVVAWDASSQQYKLAQVPITTITSLRSMQGSSGDITAGGTARLYTQDVDAFGASVSSLRTKAFISAPGPVTLEYNTANGLIYPEDYDALELLSFYAALEKARAEIAGWGFTNMNAVPIYAHVDLLNEQGLSPLADGELFLEPLNAFFLPAVSAQQQLPPQMNLGAVAHAIGLQAWQQIVWEGEPVDPALSLEATDPDALTAVHAALSVRLGIADFLGALVTQDPRWFDHSLQQTAGARALDQLRCGSSAMLQALDVPDDQVPYAPYPLGTVLAFSLWDAASSGEPVSVASGVIAALPGILSAIQANGDKLDLTQTLDAIVAASTSDQQGILCGEFLDRFQALGITDLPTCDTIGVVAPSTSCQ